MGDRRWSPPKPRPPGAPKRRAAPTTTIRRPSRKPPTPEGAVWGWVGTLRAKDGRVLGGVEFAPHGDAGLPGWQANIGGEWEKCDTRDEAILRAEVAANVVGKAERGLK